MTALRDRVFIGFLLLTLCTALVVFQSSTALPLDMRRHGINEATFGWLMGINGVMIVFLQPLITRLLSRRSRTRVLAASSLFLGIGFGLYGAVGGVAGYGLATATWTLGEIASFPMLSTVVADLAPVHLRGRYQGLYTMSWGIASCAAPIIGGALLSKNAGGGRLLWFSCLLLMSCVALLHLLLGPARQQAERQQA